MKYLHLEVKAIVVITLKIDVYYESDIYVYTSISNNVNI